MRSKERIILLIVGVLLLVVGLITYWWFSNQGSFSGEIWPEPDSSQGSEQSPTEDTTNQFIQERIDSDDNPDCDCNSDDSSSVSGGDENSQTAQSTPNNNEVESKDVNDIEVLVVGRLNSVEERSLAQVSAGNLVANKTVVVDLSSYQFLGLSFIWSSGQFKYGLSADIDSIPAFKTVTEDEGGVKKRPEKVSPLIMTSGQKKYLFLETISEVENLSIDLINPQAGASEEEDSRYSQTGDFRATGQFNRDSGAKYTSLSMISRSSWGAPSKLQLGEGCEGDADKDFNIDHPCHFTWDPEYYRVNRIIVHHTVNSNSPANPADVVRSIYIYHAYSKNWGDVGYNYLIDHKGNIYEGKAGGDETLGYHARWEPNRGSIGIALIGDFTYQKPTYDARQALKKLIAEKAAFYNFDLKYSASTGQDGRDKWKNSSYTVFGHRSSYYWDDYWIQNATACPGNAFYKDPLKTLVSNAQDYKQSHFSGIKEVEQEVNNLVSSTYEADKIYLTFKDGYNPTDYLPTFSSIVHSEVSGQDATLWVYDWNRYYWDDLNDDDIEDPDEMFYGWCPEEGWTGYDGKSYIPYPASAGTKDRIRTLLKIFMLDNKVDRASINVEGSFEV